MQDMFLSFWSYALQSVAGFLMTEPISYITGLIILAFVVGLFKRICSI